jgi:chromosome transmission fidelity protein 1
LQYIENTTEHKLAIDGIGEVERKARGKQAGREFYENFCMRTVNQSVGRLLGIERIMQLL